ncbi:sterol desaturase family protein [Thiosocius teredinicola]|uniref:sterol desaturase family protein n=1 Tax=Thiosocius teredinicola TaxID=1973002 RepID=UPI0009914779
MEVVVYIVIFLVFVAIFTREVVAPASKATCDNRWLILAASINILQMSAAIGAGYVFADVFAGNSIWHLESSFHPTIAGALTFLVASLVAYWWHRAMHASDRLWRIFHQLHHSPSRIEALTAFFAHPFDSIAATLITSCVAYLIFGFSGSAVAWAILYVSLFNLYIHSDTKSPPWVGYVVQRPEMHRVHHQLNHHANNYGLPLWDLVFGTWANPATYIDRCGFEEGRSERVYEMLMGKDVNT